MLLKVLTSTSCFDDDFSSTNHKIVSIYVVIVKVMVWFTLF